MLSLAAPALLNVGALSLLSGILLRTKTLYLLFCPEA
jgi:hypothetical protein